jgi:hypothetical protein
MHTLTRRSALTAGAAALATGTAASLATKAAAGSADAALIALGRELRAAHDLVESMTPRLDASHEAYENARERRGPPPEVCRARRDDYLALGACRGDHDGFFSGASVDEFRKLGPEHVIFEVVNSPLEPGEIEIIRKVTRPTDLGRAAEIIKAFDEWNADPAVADQSAKLDRVQDEFDDACRAMADIENQIAAIPARTIEGLRVKALAALMYEGLDGPIDDMLRDGRRALSLETGMSPSDVLFQLAWDVIELTSD